MSAFDALVRPSLVRIAAPGSGYDPHGDPYWGTGYFIAPGWVLTCAHVVAKGGSAVWRSEPALGITWAGGRTTGRVVLAKPRPATPEAELVSWSFPDLALVRVEGAEDAVCVRLGERAPAAPTPIRLYGWSYRTGEPAVLSLSGEVRGSEGKALLLDAVPTEGCSGGPVVDLGRGTVIGVVKGRARDGQGPAQGAATSLASLRELYDVPGGRILHEVLRAHDGFHLAQHRSLTVRQTWTAVQRDLWAGTGISPATRVQLYGRLAALPSPTGPGEVMDLVDRVKRRVLHPEYQAVLETDARTWRDGVGLLRELHAGDPRTADLRPGDPRAAETLVYARGDRSGSADPGRDAVLLYAAHVVRHVTERYGPVPGAAGLADWIGEEAYAAHAAVREDIAVLLDPDGPHTGAGNGREPGARADVRIEIDAVPWATPRRYAWRVMLRFAGGGDGHGGHDGHDGHGSHGSHDGAGSTISPLRGDDKGVPRERLRETLRGPLAEALALGDSGDHLARVEVVLPRELFDEPVDTWRLAPDDEPFGERSLPLGQRRVVFLRDRHRSHHPPSPEWRLRWRGSAAGPLRAVPLRGEVLTPGAEGHGPQLRRESRMAVYARLGAAGGGSVPVYCGPVAAGDGRRAMEAALAAGHPIALWRRADDDHGDCAAFHKQADAFLRDAGRADGMHQPLRMLRLLAGDTEAGPQGRSEHAWAEDLAVLYDPPDQALFDAPLLGPLPLDDTRGAEGTGGAYGSGKAYGSGGAHGNEGARANGWANGTSGSKGSHTPNGTPEANGSPGIPGPEETPAPDGTRARRP
ncbi:trypsin-like peptidase domain-containing protein [Streptomyces sp. NPDC048717]|uniref:VMAP-C domain-containing protein n=1 Tax=Streptomyces sp. NPDC048717 TaxID=3154928 RepID=UPI003428BB44